jgi:putative transposase
VAVGQSNQRWASDITGLKAWNGQKGRLAIILDCSDRMILAWRFSPRITAEDLCEMLREAIFRRFGENRGKAKGIEFLSDNGPEYGAHKLQQLFKKLGIIACRTPCRSPESNGIAEAFFGSFKRDYIYQNCLETIYHIKSGLPSWIEHYNNVAPHSALKMYSPMGFYEKELSKMSETPVQS